MARGVREARLAAIALAAIAGVSVFPMSLVAETLPSALTQAYQNNPQLNAERARLRATDEGVPQALSGYRPQISATADVGVQYIDQLGTTGAITGTTVPRGAGITGTQTLFNGLRTANRTRAAEGQVFAGREALRVLEQQVLLDAVTAYMNVLRDTAILDLQRRNVEVLEEQLRQTRDRFNVGEVTRTDVAQSEARLAAARSSALAAESTLTTSRATYRRIIGVEAARLSPGMPVDRLSPRTLPAATARGIAENPLVTSAMYGVDVAQLQVKINEGALYPTLRGAGQRATALRHVADYPADIHGCRRRAAFDPDLPGRYRVLTDPPVEGNAWASSASTSNSSVTRYAPPWFRPGAFSRPPRRKFRPPKCKSTPRRSRLTACARRRAWASARRSTCSTPSRNWSMRVSRS